MKIITHSMPSLDNAEVSALSEVLRSRHIATGEEVTGFEKEMAEYCDVLGAIACSSGTAAIHLALLGLGIGKGMEIILPSFSCASLYQAVLYTGATPVLADCHPGTFLLTSETIMERITHKTKAIILPHMFGLPADIDEIISLGLPVVEDISQSLGAEYRGVKTGAHTEVAVTSFYATKMITTGTGGMVLSNNPKLLEKIRDLNGVDKKKGLGLRLPYLMNDVQAAMGRCQLKKLDKFISRRREVASQFYMALKSMPVELPTDMPFRKHIYFRYCLKLDQPIDPVIQLLQQNGVRAERPVFSPLHLLDHQKPINKRVCFAGTEKAWMNTISLPIYPDISKNEIEREIYFLKKDLST